MSEFPVSRDSNEDKYYTQQNYCAATVMLTTFGVDFVLGLVLPYLLLPLFPGERSPVTSAVICLSVAGLNYLAWRTADQVSLRRVEHCSDCMCFYSHRLEPLG